MKRQTLATSNFSAKQTGPKIDMFVSPKAGAEGMTLVNVRQNQLALLGREKHLTNDVCTLHSVGTLARLLSCAWAGREPAIRQQCVCPLQADRLRA